MSPGTARDHPRSVRITNPVHQQMAPTESDIMINWNDIKNFDVTDIDLTGLDLASLEFPRFEMPDIEMPDFEMPKLPEIDLPVDEVVGFARDAAYAGIGAVVITAQKADERRRGLSDQVTSQVRKVVDSIA